MYLPIIDDKSVNETYNREGIRKFTVLEVAETINRLLGGSEDRVHAARPGDYSSKEVSAGKAKPDPGCELMIDFEEGMRWTMEWYLRRFEDRR